MIQHDVASVPWDTGILPGVVMSCAPAMSWSAIHIVVPMGIACEASVIGTSSINAVTKTTRRVCVKTLIQRYCLIGAN